MKVREIERVLETFYKITSWLNVNDSSNLIGDFEERKRIKEDAIDWFWCLGYPKRQKFLELMKENL